MSEVGVEKATNRFRQAKQHFIQYISSTEEDDLYYYYPSMLLSKLLRGNYWGLDKDYQQTKLKLVNIIDKLNLADETIKQELVWFCTVFIAIQWHDSFESCHCLELTPPINGSIKEFRAIIAALKKLKFQIIQKNNDYCVIKSEKQEGRFWFLENKGRWIANQVELNILIQQAISEMNSAAEQEQGETNLQPIKQPLLTTEQQEQPIKAAYVMNDINTNLREYELTQKEVVELVDQFRVDLLSFIENRFSELPESLPISIGTPGYVSPWNNPTSAGPVTPWDIDDSPSSSKPSQKNTDKKWWQLWKQ